MNRKIPLLCAALLFPVVAGAMDVKLVKSLEFSSLDGPVRLQNGQVVFSHYDQSGNAHNAVLMNPVNASFRNAVEGVPSARFVAEDERYLVYTSRNAEGWLLNALNKSALGATSLAQRHIIRWGHIDKDRLIAVQGGAPHMEQATVLLFSLPSLKPQGTAEIVGGNDTALWGDKIVSIGNNLGIYTLGLRKIAVVEMPPREPGGRACMGGPLRIWGDKAIVGSDCKRLVVVDLPSARVERVIPVDSPSQSFDVSDGLILAVNPDGKQEVQVIELASGIELIRLPINANFLAMRANRVLTMKKGERFTDPAQFTLHEVDLATVKSESFRTARVKDGCDAAGRALVQNGDLHAAIEACEKSGIRSFTDRPSPELLNAVRDYAVWLARTLSRYNEGSALLERLGPGAADQKFATELAAARQKARYLDPPSRNNPPAAGAEPPGVSSVPVDFGGYSDVIAFEGDRIYIGRWLCDAKPKGYRGVVLDVLDRNTFRMIKRVEVAACDFGQLDTITTIAVMQGYVVLGVNYRIPRQDRPNVVVVDAEALEVKASGFVGKALGLKNWRGTLLSCAPTPGRFDPESVKLVEATQAEAAACAKGGAELRNSATAGAPILPVLETARFRAQHVPGQATSYRIAGKNTEKTVATLPPRAYLEVLPVTGRDALVTSYAHGPYRRFMLFDIARQSEVPLFELDPAGRPLLSVVWRDFLFAGLGRDLLVYDLNRLAVIKYEKDFLPEASRAGRGGVKRFLLDNDRMLIPALNNENSRVIDLNVYLARPPEKDFFAP